MLIPDPLSVGAYIRKARLAQNLSQLTLSDLALVSTHFLSDLERGKPTVELGKVFQVVATLGLEIHFVPRGVRANDRD